MVRLKLVAVDPFKWVNRDKLANSEKKTKNYRGIVQLFDDNISSLQCMTSKEPVKVSLVYFFECLKLLTLFKNLSYYC